MATLGGLAVLGLFVAGRGLPAWYRWYRETSDSAKAVGLAATEAAASVRNATRMSGARRRAELTSEIVEPTYITGNAPATAAADLASKVREAAQRSGLQMGSIETSIDSSRVAGSPLVSVRVRGESTGEVASISHFLAGVEGNLPLMAVREVSITQTDPTAGSDAAHVIQLRFVLESLAYVSGSRDSR